MTQPRASPLRAGRRGERHRSKLCQRLPEKRDDALTCASPFAAPRRLLIKGIRSFSPENTAVLQFDTPLTLIVGQNGAGKTVSIDVGSCSEPVVPFVR